MILWHCVRSYSQYMKVDPVFNDDAAVSVLKFENNLHVSKAVSVMYGHDGGCSQTRIATCSTKAPPPHTSAR
jgi:hypothetical protein